MTQEAFIPPTPEEIALEKLLTLKAEVVSEILSSLKSEYSKNLASVDLESAKQKICNILSSYSNRLDFSDVLKFISHPKTTFELDPKSISFDTLFNFLSIAYIENKTTAFLSSCIEVKLKD
jgi:hypothetical protein